MLSRTRCQAQHKVLDFRVSKGKSKHPLTLQSSNAVYSEAQIKYNLLLNVMQPYQNTIYHKVLKIFLAL